MFVLIMASTHNLDLFCCQPVFVDPKTVRSISSGSATNSDIGFISLRLRFFVARRQRRLRPQISVLIGSEFEKIPLAIWLESVSTVFIPFDTSFCIARETVFFLFGPSGLDGAIRGRCVRVVMRGCPYTSAIDSVWPFFFSICTTRCCRLLLCQMHGSEDGRPWTAAWPWFLRRWKASPPVTHCGSKKRYVNITRMLLPTECNVLGDDGRPSGRRFECFTQKTKIFNGERANVRPRSMAPFAKTGRHDPIE